MRGLIIFLIFLIVFFAIAFAQNLPKTLRVTGVGTIPENAETAAQGKAMGRRGALVDAYRNLAETVKGLSLTSETKVENLMVKSDKINTKVQAIVKGAQVVDERYLPGGMIEIDLFIDEAGMKEIIRLSEQLDAENGDGNDRNDDGVPDDWGDVHPVSMEEWTEIVYDQWVEHRLAQMPPPPPEIPSSDSQIINGNFEDSTMTGWTLFGDAWNDNPTQYNQNKIEGNYYIASFINDVEAQGTAISDPFVITKSKILFLVGGGKNPMGKPKETTINLIVRGEVIYSATGEDNNDYREVVWDLGQYQGSTGQIKIIDANSGENGYIFVDNIRMMN